MNTIVNEFDTIDLGDKRLENRSAKILKTLAANPQGSINASHNGWNETIAAYRFFQNPKVTCQSILQPHIDATKKRIQGEPVVLILQDTTELDLSKHPPKDARHLNHKNRLGLYDHTHLAVTPGHLALGVLGQKFFDRDAETLGKAHQRETLPIEKKESFRWLEGYRLASEIANEFPDTNIISIADREADIYDIFLEHQSLEKPADYIIRAQKQKQRSTPNLDTTAGAANYCKIWDELSKTKVLSVKTVEINATPKRQARLAKLEIRAMQVEVKPPHARRKLPSVKMNIISAEEVGNTTQDSDISWHLMTSLPIDNIENVECVIEYYRARWAIEVYFRTLKTGCCVEEIQLESRERYIKCLSFYKIIAWRVMLLTILNRQKPELTADVIFSPAEWKSVWKIATGENPPASCPTIEQFIPLLAKLGGYNMRKRDRYPGPQSIWTGLRRMNDFAIAWLAFGPE